MFWVCDSVTVCAGQAIIQACGFVSIGGTAVALGGGNQQPLSRFSRGGRRAVLLPHHRCHDCMVGDDVESLPNKSNTRGGVSCIIVVAAKLSKDFRQGRIAKFRS